MANNHIFTSYSTHTYKCTQVNLARSRNAYQELLNHLHDSKDDVALITEPYLGSSDTFTKKVPGYQTFQYPSNSPIKSIILIKDRELSAIGLSNHSNSNLCIVQLNCKSGKKIYLISIYVEPRTDEHLTLSKLESFLHNTQGSTHIIGGDFNGWHTAWGSNRNNRRGNSIYDLTTLYTLRIHNNGSTPTFETVTHGRHRESIIDLTLSSTTTSSQINDWKVNLNMCPSSDHNALQYNISLNQFQPSTNKKLSTFKYNTSNLIWTDSLIKSFSAEASKRLPPETNTDINTLSANGLDNYIKQVTGAIQKACDKTLPKAKKYKPTPPWWSDELNTIKLSIIKNHHKLIKLKRRNLSLTQVIEERNKLKKKYTEAICSASTDNFREFCSNQGKEDVWSITNRLINSRPDYITQPPSTLRLANGDYTTNSEETTKALMDNFFPSDSPDTTDFQKTLRLNMNQPIHTAEEPPFSTLEIIECLKSMNHKKAPGSDHLTSDICFQFTSNFPHIITSIMNRCLKLNYFPNSWKIAIAKIIPKHNK